MFSKIQVFDNFPLKNNIQSDYYISSQSSQNSSDYTKKSSAASASEDDKSNKISSIPSLPPSISDEDDSLIKSLKSVRINNRINKAPIPLPTARTKNVSELTKLKRQVSSLYVLYQGLEATITEKNVWFDKAQGSIESRVKIRSQEGTKRKPYRRNSIGSTTSSYIKNYRYKPNEPKLKDLRPLQKRIQNLESHVFDLSNNFRELASKTNMIIGKLNENIDKINNLEKEKIKQKYHSKPHPNQISIKKTKRFFRFKWFENKFNKI
ncbi:hypothetical protein A3Q56_01647 [Intoshia linei]|uniref:Uncharacterized protein n=1 Tax=Intoshia linei TaxID=1819745 RepID=A0A177B8C0_9BILA|nr:hypothetical protein A3Q56_01647 [Intoshia linei]